MDKNMFKEYIDNNPKLQEAIKQQCIDIASFKNPNSIADTFKSCLDELFDVKAMAILEMCGNG